MSAAYVNRTWRNDPWIEMRMSLSDATLIQDLLSRKYVESGSTLAWELSSELGTAIKQYRFEVEDVPE